MVAGGGGHLEELCLLRPRLVGISEQLTWVTPDTAQSRGLLLGEERIAIPKARPHDVRAAVVTTERALAVLRGHRFDQVVSTGSLPAVPFLTIARARGLPCHFIESAARVEGPSLTGAILERVPGVHRYGQYEWGRPRWEYRGSVFDGFTGAPNPDGAVRRIVVTVGVSGYGFRRLLEAVRRAAPAGAEVLWQTGSTDVRGLDIAAVPTMAAEDLTAAVTAADVVIAHAGVGSALTAMAAGKCPILVPRLRVHGEHADDHQREVARRLAAAGLALTCDPDSLDADLLTEAARRRIVRNEHARPFVLSAH